MNNIQKSDYTQTNSIFGASVPSTKLNAKFWKLIVVVLVVYPILLKYVTQVFDWKLFSPSQIFFRNVFEKFVYDQSVFQKWKISYRDYLRILYKNYEFFLICRQIIRKKKCSWNNWLLLVLYVIELCVDLLWLSYLLLFESERIM